ncbi:MAG: cell wall-binding repeat-containing protein, partial [Chloroflexi bacterium]|nr:cell wall-binding repeat-containing protein [Chloroflexota bacterium]
LLAGLGAVTPVSAPAASAATGPKVAIIVGATHSATAQYRSYADQIYAEAIKYTANVIKVYSPNATWTKVKAAVDGASIIVYLGHGNGWPSPYTYDPNYTTKDGFGLNYDVNKDGKLSDNELKYYGEPSIRTLTPAPNAVVLLFHLCYASGNSEPGRAAPSLSTAKQRVDNYAAAFLRAGAKAVIADGHSHTGYISRLFTTVESVDQLWRGMPNANGHVMSYASVRSPGSTYQLDPDNATSSFYRSMTGSLDLTTVDVTGADFAVTDTDPADFQVPGAASVAVDNAPLYASADDAAAAHAIAGGVSDVAGDPPASEPPVPIATLPLDQKLRVSGTVTMQDDTEVLDVRTFDGAAAGWMIGDAATPRDSRSPMVWSVSDGNALFTPNGDGDRDTYHLSVRISESASWTLRIQDGSGTTLITKTGTGATAALTWDGRTGGKLVPDGTYRWRLSAADAWGNSELTSTATFLLDHDPKLTQRLAGTDRFATAAAISAATFAPGVPVVYIANGLNFPDALAGAAAAGKTGAPMLLVRRDAVPAATATELARLRPAKIIVLGGTSMVS